MTTNSPVSNILLPMFSIFFIITCSSIPALTYCCTFLLFPPPVIPLKTELAVELQEKGRVRFWLQAEKISANGKIQYVFNDNTLSQGEVSWHALGLN